MKLNDKFKAMLDEPIFEGDPTTLRMALCALADLGDGGMTWPGKVQNETGLRWEECERIAKTTSKVVAGMADEGRPQ